MRLGPGELSDAAARARAQNEAALRFAWGEVAFASLMGVSPEKPGDKQPSFLLWGATWQVRTEKPDVPLRLYRAGATAPALDVTVLVWKRSNTEGSVVGWALREDFLGPLVREGEFAGTKGMVRYLAPEDLRPPQELVAVAIEPDWDWEAPRPQLIARTARAAGALAVIGYPPRDVWTFAEVRKLKSAGTDHAAMRQIAEGRDLFAGTVVDSRTLQGEP